MIGMLAQVGIIGLYFVDLSLAIVGGGKEIVVLFTNFDM